MRARGGAPGSASEGRSAAAGPGRALRGDLPAPPARSRRWHAELAAVAVAEGPAAVPRRRAGRLRSSAASRRRCRGEQVRSDTGVPRRPIQNGGFAHVTAVPLTPASRPAAGCRTAACPEPCGPGLPGTHSLSPRHKGRVISRVKPCFAKPASGPGGWVSVRPPCTGPAGVPAAPRAAVHSHTSGRTAPSVRTERRGGRGVPWLSLQVGAPLRWRLESVNSGSGVLLMA